MKSRKNNFNTTPKFYFYLEIAKLLPNHFHSWTKISLSFQQESKAKEQEKESIDDDQLLDIPKELLREEVDFLSSHFTEIDHNKLKNLRVSLIESVISNQLLLLENENSLFQFIVSLYSENSSLSYLFENVDFLNISDDCIEQFYEIFDLNRFTIQKVCFILFFFWQYCKYKHCFSQK